MKIKKIIAYVLASLLSVSTFSVRPASALSSDETDIKTKTVIIKPENKKEELNEQIVELKQELKKQKSKLKESKNEGFLSKVGNLCLKVIKKTSFALVTFISSHALLLGTDKGINFANRCLRNMDCDTPDPSDLGVLITILSAAPSLLVFTIA